MRRGRLLAVLAGLAIASLSVVTAFAAVPPDDRNVPSEQDFLVRTNQERASRGLAGLAAADDLVAIARHHSQDMADQKRLYHDPNLPNEVQGWETLGENVGTGGSVEDVHRAFMASQVHRDEILDGRYTQIGIGVVWDGATLWVTEVFRQPQAPRPAPKPAPSTAPAPAAAPPPPPARQLAAAPASTPPRAAPTSPAPLPSASPVTATAPAPVAPTAAPAPAPATTTGAIQSATAADLARHGVPTEVKGVVRTRTQDVALALPARVPRVPAPVGIAAALLSLVIAVQGWVVQRLGLA